MLGRPSSLCCRRPAPNEKFCARAPDGPAIPGAGSLCTRGGRTSATDACSALCSAAPARSSSTGCPRASTPQRWAASTDDRPTKTGPARGCAGERGARRGLLDAARAERIGQWLRGRPEGDLDLDGHPRCGEAEHVGGVVMPRRRRNPGVLVGERVRLLHPAEGVGFCSARDERPRSGDRPAGDVKRGVTGIGACGEGEQELQPASRHADTLHPGELVRT
jgi:hypothetical protein